MGLTKTIPSRETLEADRTGERFVVRVGEAMAVEMLGTSKGGATQVAAVVARGQAGLHCGATARAGG